MGFLSNITTSTLTHHSVSSSNIISNNSSLPLADIVRLGLLCIEVSTPYKECSFPFLIDVGSHNSPPSEPAFSSAYHLVSNSNTICPLWLVTYRSQPRNFKTCLVGRGFHSLIRNVRSPLQLTWDFTIHPLRSSVLAGIPLGIWLWYHLSTLTCYVLPSASRF